MFDLQTMLLLLFAAVALVAISVAFYASRNTRRVNEVLWRMLNPPREIPTDRLILPLMSTEKSKDPAKENQVVPLKLKKGFSTEVTVRVQDRAFSPERVVIASAGTKGGAADWLVNDVKVANRSQFSQAGDVPGDMFAATTIDNFVRFATVEVSRDFTMVVTYIGENLEGAVFSAAVLGSARPDMPMNMLLKDAIPPMPLNRKQRKLRDKFKKNAMQFGAQMDREDLRERLSSVRPVHPN